jgi:hypothetical protein
MLSEQGDDALNFVLPQTPVYCLDLFIFYYFQPAYRPIFLLSSHLPPPTIRPSLSLLLSPRVFSSPSYVVKGPSYPVTASLGWEDRFPALI